MLPAGALREAAESPSRKTARRRPRRPELELERICKGLATLDAILCDEWDMRYYSFQQAWSAEHSERMASMRDGSGDQWFIVFSERGDAFVKAFWHEHPREGRLPDLRGSSGSAGTAADRTRVLDERGHVRRLA